MSMSKNIVMAIIIGSLMGGYVWYCQGIWDWIGATYGIEGSQFTYSIGAGMTFLFALMLSKIITFGMRKKK